MSITNFTGTVEKLVFGGDGLIRKDGLVIFVPGVIPGEEVRVNVSLRKKNFARGNLVEILRPSPYRISPCCRHFGECGGCQLQHIASSLHAEIKKGWLREALYGLFKPGLLPTLAPWASPDCSRSAIHDESQTLKSWERSEARSIDQSGSLRDKIGSNPGLKGEITFVSTEDVFFWRRKITLHAVLRDGLWKLGYFAPDNTTIVEIDECGLFFTELKSILFLKKLLKSIPAQEHDRIDMELFRLPIDGLALRMQGSRELDSLSKKSTVSALKNPALFKTFALRFGSWSYAEDDFYDPILFHALGRPYYFSLEAFVQNHVTLGEKLWGDVVKIVDQQGRNQEILDLYAGIGVTAIALAEKGHSVTAVEWNKKAIACGQKTCLEMKFKPKFVCDSVEKALSTIHKKAGTWILNPPRTGLSRRAQELIKEKLPQNIVYVSCSPATLARDVKELIHSGWMLNAVQGYDMFPQTTHLETVALLSRLS